MGAEDHKPLASEDGEISEQDKTMDTTDMLKDFFLPSESSLSVVHSWESSTLSPANKFIKILKFYM